MDKRLMLSVLLVVLSWGFTTTQTTGNNVTASATNGTTISPASNATTVNAATNASTSASANNATTMAPASNASTSASANNATTIAPASNASNSASANNATTMAPASNTSTSGSASNASTIVPASNASTSASASNASTSASASNATTIAPASNASTSASASNASTSASANNATTMAPASNGTTAAQVNVPALEAQFSRQECGSTKLCADEPSKCDPATGDNCFFLSARQQSGQKFNFELSGQSSGYIAAGVSTAASQTGRHRAYICANNNGAVRFFTGFLNNLELNTTETLDSSNQQGTVKNGKIQCRFTAELPDTSSRASAQYSLSITTGSYNANSGQLGTPSFKVLTPLANISDPTANITNVLANNGTASSAYVVTPSHSFLPALLVTVCMLAFTAV